MVQRRTRSNFQPRDQALRVKFTPAEKALIEEAAARANMATRAWMATTVLAATSDGSVSDRQALRDAVAEVVAARTEVVRAGTNVNQIARRLNSGEAVSLQGVADTITYLNQVVDRLDVQAAKISKVIG